MNEHCPHCGLRYEREPGFFDGSMYISYGMSVALVVTVFVAMNVLFESPSALEMIAVVVAIILPGFPVFWRLSRVLYLHAFGGVKFDPSKASSSQKG